MPEPSLPILEVEGYRDVRVLQPGLAYYRAFLTAREPFAFVKRTHGFWDRLVDLLEAIPDYPWVRRRGKLRRRLDKLRGAEPPANGLLFSEPPLDKARRRARDFVITDAIAEKLEARRRYKHFWRGGFVDDLIEDLQNPHPEDAYIVSLAFTGYHSAKKRALHEPRFLRQAWQVFSTSDKPDHDSLVWKEAAIVGELGPVVRDLRAFTLIVVGPDHLASLGERAGWGEVRHVPIHPTEAIAHREDVLTRTREALTATRARRPEVAVIYQAGALAGWLIQRVWPDSRDVFHLDLGRVLDMWYPDIVERQPWFRDHRETIIRGNALGHLFD